MVSEPTSQDHKPQGKGSATCYWRRRWPCGSCRSTWSKSCPPGSTRALPSPGSLAGLSLPGWARAPGWAPRLKPTASGFCSCCPQIAPAWHSPFDPRCHTQLPPPSSSTAAPCSQKAVDTGVEGDRTCAGCGASLGYSKLKVKFTSLPILEIGRQRVRDWPKSCRRNRAKMIDSTGLAWAPQPGG